MTTTGSLIPPKYFTGTAIRISAMSSTPTIQAMTRYRRRAAGTPCPTRRASARGRGLRYSVCSAAMVASPAQRLGVQLREVGVVGGQFGVSGRVDAGPLVQDQVAARLVLVRVAPQLVPDHADVEEQPHEPVQRPLQGVTPVHGATAGLGLGQLP